MEQNMSAKSKNNPLGVDRASLGKLKPADLRTAATANMVLSYLSSLETENAELKVKVETQSTYVNGYAISQNNARIAAFLSLISTVCVGFSINLFTSKESVIASLALLIVGVVLQTGSIVMAFKR